MNLSKLIDSLISAIKANGPEILTGLAITGVGTTAVVAARGGFQAGQRLSYEKPNMTFKEKVKVTWPFYMPALVSGAGTVTCIVLASKGNAKRTAAAVTAYSVTEKAFSDYRDKMVEQYSRAKDQKILDAAAHQQVLDKPPPPPSASLIVLGRDEVLCCELYTMRYFRSSMETLNRTVNEINRYINYNRKATLSDFYAELGLPETDASPYLGWTDAQILELDFSHGLTEDGRPYLSFRYNHGPDPLVKE